MSLSIIRLIFMKIPFFYFFRFFTLFSSPHFYFRILPHSLYLPVLYPCFQNIMMTNTLYLYSNSQIAHYSLARIHPQTLQQPVQGSYSHIHQRKCIKNSRIQWRFEFVFLCVSTQSHSIRMRNMDILNLLDNYFDCTSDHINEVWNLLLIVSLILF